MLFFSLKINLVGFSGLIFELNSVNTNHHFAIVLRSFDVLILLRDLEQLSFIQTELLKEFTIILSTHLSKSV